VVFHIAILYSIYLSGGGGQATFRNTAAVVSVLFGGRHRREGWGRAVARGHWSGGQWASPGSQPVIGKRSAVQHVKLRPH